MNALFVDSLLAKNIYFFIIRGDDYNDLSENIFFLITY